MLFKYWSIIVTFLLCITRTTLAGDTGCFSSSEKFTDLTDSGDISDIIRSFCKDHSGSVNYGSRVSNTKFGMAQGIGEDNSWNEV